MKVVHAYNDYWKTDLAAVYNQGGVFIAPTESVYGLSCDARDEDAVERIFRIKRRPQEKPMIVLAERLKSVAEYCVLSEDLQEWLEGYWPGPLTVVLNAREGVFAKNVLAGGTTVAMRVTSSPVMQDCIRMNGAPVVSTSANLSGDPPITASTEVRAIFDALEEQPDLFIDAGDLPHALPSTIVDCTRTPWRIVRNGSLIPTLPHAA